MEQTAELGAALSTVLSRWIYKLQVQVLSDQAEMMHLVMGELQEQCRTPITKQYREAETTTASDSTMRLEVLRQRVKESTDLIRCLRQCFVTKRRELGANKEATQEVADSEKEVQCIVGNDDDSVFIAANSDTAAPSMQNMSSDLVSSTDQGADDRDPSCLEAADNDVVFYANPITTSYSDVVRRMVATHQLQSCGAHNTAEETSRRCITTMSEVTMGLSSRSRVVWQYWPKEWSVNDPLELGWWIRKVSDKVSPEKTKDTDEQKLIVAEIKENCTSRSNSDVEFGVMASIFHQRFIATTTASSDTTDEPVEAAAVDVDNSTTPNNPTAASVTIAASIFDEAFTSSQTSEVPTVASSQQDSLVSIGNKALKQDDEFVANMPSHEIMSRKEPPVQLLAGSQNDTRAIPTSSRETIPFKDEMMEIISDGVNVGNDDGLRNDRFNDGLKTFAEVLKNGVARRAVNCRSDEALTTTATTDEATDEYETVSASRPQWRRKLKLFEMKAQAFLEGHMPLPTFNYYDVLMNDTVEMMDTKSALHDDDCAEEACDDGYERKQVSWQKWRKKKHMFEERAHEWKQWHYDDGRESVPQLSNNSYAVLADNVGFVSDSSENHEDEEPHV